MSRRRTLIAQALAFALLPGCIVAPALAQPALVVCSELADSDRTRLVLRLGTVVESLIIVTPDFLWPTPGQPETARFPANYSDTSPDLTALDVHIETLSGTDGEPRIVDFAARTPDALPYEGLRGSWALHDTWVNSRAVASLYYTGSDGTIEVIALGCRRFGNTQRRM
jgi:hypothetical protein